MVAACLLGGATVDPSRCLQPVAFVDAQVSDTKKCSCGLGNLLFMIVAGLSCGVDVVLVRTRLVMHGTPAGKAARTRKYELGAYPNTLLRNFLSVEPPTKADLPRQHFALSSSPRDCSDHGNRSFVVRSYAQAPGFIEHVPKLLARLWWPPQRLDDGSTRYRGIRHGTCVCLRLSKDFQHRPISRARYETALAHLRDQGESIEPLFLVGDYTAPWTDEWGLPNGTAIAENDVVQVAVARHCRNFVLSQSTFHVWLAYAAVRPRHVIVFNDTDITHTGMHQASWSPRPWTVLP